MAYRKLRAMGEEEETQDGRRHVKQCMRCKSPGCCADLLVWYHSEGIEASILMHGKHYHGKEEWKTLGLSDSTKKTWTLGSNEL